MPDKKRLKNLEGKTDPGEINQILETYGVSKRKAWEKDRDIKRIDWDATRSDRQIQWRATRRTKKEDWKKKREKRKQEWEHKS
jgi:hypothetical protein